MNVRGWTTLAVTLLTVAACRPADQRTDSVDAEAARRERESWPAEVRAQLDSGNAAFRERDVESALLHFRNVTDADPDNAAGWFGIYLAERALGNEQAAEDALQRAQANAPGASLIHPGEGDSIR